MFYNSDRQHGIPPSRASVTLGHLASQQVACQIVDLKKTYETDKEQI